MSSYNSDFTIHRVKRIEVKTREHDDFICIKLVVYNANNDYTEINLFVNEEEYKDFEFDTSGVKFEDSGIRAKIKKLFGVSDE